MSDTSRRRLCLAVLVWWCGLAISTALLALDLASVVWSALPPGTPFDGTRSGHSEQWRFLAAAAAVVPDGASFTVRAEQSETEMSLYMMSVGMLPRSLAIPNTYYGRPVAEAANARFVLIHGEPAGGIAPRGRTIELPGGFATDRGSSPP